MSHSFKVMLYLLSSAKPGGHKASSLLPLTWYLAAPPSGLHTSCDQQFDRFPLLLGEVKTSVHQQAQPRFMVLSLAEAQRQGLPIWPTATMVSLVWLTRARALGV